MLAHFWMPFYDVVLPSVDIQGDNETFWVFSAD
jgi:hypothetical protein